MAAAKGLLSLLLCLGAALGKVAAQQVEVTPLGDDCSVYPNYDSTTDTAGPFSIAAHHTAQGYLDGDNPGVIFNRGPRGIANGYVTIQKHGGYGDVLFRCVNDSLQGLVPTGVSGTTWEDLAVPIDFGYQRPLMMYLAPGAGIKPYSLAEDGVDDPYIYLGADGVVDWGFQHWNSTEFGRSWIPWLLVEGSLPVSEDELSGHLRVLPL